jgi:RNA polymerase sigma-70 factor, ECF subfamily
VSKPARTDFAMATGEVSLGVVDARAAAGTGERGLVEQCRAGDPHAFARLVAVHEGMVFNLATRLLGDPEEAKDVSQEVFLQVYRTLSRFEARSTLKTWIYRIVVNQCHNRRRFWSRRGKGKGRPLTDLTPAEEASLAAARPDPASPYDEVCRRERAERMQRALLGVSFQHRAILLLREVEGLSCEAIAATLQVPEGTVKSRLARAREALRVQYEAGAEARR